MTEAGARLALQHKTNAEAYFKQFTESQKIVETQGLQIVELETDNTAAKREIRRLKIRNTLKDIEVWAYRIVIIFGAAYVSQKK